MELALLAAEVNDPHAVAAALASQDINWDLLIKTARRFKEGQNSVTALLQRCGLKVGTIQKIVFHLEEVNYGHGASR